MCLDRMRRVPVSLAGKGAGHHAKHPAVVVVDIVVVLWLFVLVPMLVSKRDAVRRTSDVALATRVLNSDTAARLIKRGGRRQDIAVTRTGSPKTNTTTWTTSTPTTRRTPRRRASSSRSRRGVC